MKKNIAGQTSTEMLLVALSLLGILLIMPELINAIADRHDAMLFNLALPI